MRQPHLSYVDVSDLTFKLHSIDPEIMIGYRRPIRNKHIAYVKVGIQQKRFKEQVGGAATPAIRFYNVAPRVYQGTEIYTYETSLGWSNEVTSTRHSRPRAIRLSIGDDIKLSSGFVSSVSIGLDFAVRMHKGVTQWIDFYSYEHVNSSSPNISSYEDGMASVGLRVAANMWWKRKLPKHRSTAPTLNWR